MQVNESDFRKRSRDTLYSETTATTPSSNLGVDVPAILAPAPKRVPTFEERTKSFYANLQELLDRKDFNDLHIFIKYLINLCNIKNLVLQNSLEITFRGITWNEIRYENFLRLLRLFCETDLAPFKNSTSIEILRDLEGIQDHLKAKKDIFFHSQPVPTYLLTILAKYGFTLSPSNRWNCADLCDQVITCEGKPVFYVLRQLLQEDLEHYSEKIEIESTLKAGWEILFHFIHTKGQLPHNVINTLRTSYELYCLFAHCVLISGSRSAVSFLHKFICLPNDPTWGDAFIERMKVELTKLKSPEFQQFLNKYEEILFANYLDEYVLEPLCHPEYFDMIKQKGPHFQSLQVFSLNGGLEKVFHTLCPNVTELVINQIESASEIESLFQFGHRFVSIKILKCTQDFPLSVLEGCPSLESVSISFEGDEDKVKVAPFQQPEKLAKLKMLVLKSARCKGRVLRSISGLKNLQSLELDKSIFKRADFQSLYACRQLLSLQLNISFYDQQRLTPCQSQLLASRLPNTTFTGFAPDKSGAFSDFEGYREVITPKPLGSSEQYAYSLSHPEKIEEHKKLLFTDLFFALENQDAYFDHQVASKHFEENRYSNIVPLDHNLLPVRKYLNASPIFCPDGRLRIAAQGPLEHTQLIFWQSILELKTHLIVMTTSLRENGEEKCSAYYPQKLGEKKIIQQGSHEISVTLKEEKHFPGTLQVVLRQFEVSRNEVVHHSSYADGTVQKTIIQSAAKQDVYQIHLPKWGDHAGMSGEYMWQLITFIEEFEKMNPQSSTLLHCSAGAGRTGTTLACQILAQLLRQQKTLDVEFHLDLLLKDLRKQRIGMVQSEQQIATILEFFQLSPQFILASREQIFP